MILPSRPRSEPGDVTRYIAVVALLGVLALLVWTVRGSATMEASLPAAMILVGIGVVTVWIPVQFHRAGGIVGFNLLGAVFIAAVLAVSPFLAPVILTVASFIGYATRLREARKIAFNVGQDAVWAVVASAVIELIGVGSTPASARSIASGLVAAATMVVVNGVLVQGLFRRLEDRRMSDHVRLTGSLYAGTFAGNLVYGLVLATTLAASNVMAVLMAALLAMVSFGYRGLVAAQAGRERVDRLHAMSQELVEVSGARVSLEPALALLTELVGASTAEYVDAATGAVQSHTSEAGAADTTDEGLAAPVQHHGQVLGELRVRGRRGLGAWDAADDTLLRSVANDLAVVIQNHALFDDLQRERAALAVEARKLADILGAASDGITLIGQDGLVRSWNPAMARITGVEGQAASGRPWYAILRLRDEDGNEIGAQHDQVLSGALRGVRSDQAVLWQIMRDDGEWRWVRCTASPLAPTEDTPGGAVLVVRDVTSETEVDNLKNDFIATVSHELRTPMTPLKGFLGTLRKHGSVLDEEQRQVVLASMNGQVKRLDLLVNDLLAVAELARGQFELAAGLVPLGPVVREVVAARSTSERERITVTEAGDALACGDGEGIRRIVAALVDNALKHTSEPIEVTVVDGPAEVTIEVEDHGPGIATRDRERIFERFVRLGNHLHRTQGPGLGLTIARALAVQMEGAIELRSTVGSGTTFAVRLPTGRGSATLRDVSLDRSNDEPSSEMSQHLPPTAS